MGVATVLRTLAELRNECAQLGLTVPLHRNKNGKERELRGNYIKALQRYHLERTPKTWGLEQRLLIDSPMLCGRYQQLHPHEQAELWQSPDWVMQEKIDGCRMLVFWKRGDGFSFYSRHFSVEDFLPVNYTSNVLHNTDETLLPYDSFIIDAEVVSKEGNISTVLASRGVVTETTLQAVVALLSMDTARSHAIQREYDYPLWLECFDVLQVNGAWVVAEPFIERHTKLRRIVSFLSTAGFPGSLLDFVEITSDNPTAKIEMYHDLIEAGREGVVAKHKASPYVMTESRARGGWFKVKRSAALQVKDQADKGANSDIPMVGKDTVDAFVTGFSRGKPGTGLEHLVGSITFSVLLETESGDEVQHEIGKISQMPEEFRRQITVVLPDGTPSLAGWMYSRIASISGQAISARSRRLKHCVLVAWREDKSVYDCRVLEAELNANIY